jgi:hypothetical protein
MRGRVRVKDKKENLPKNLQVSLSSFTLEE